MKTKLATSTTLAGIEKLINQFYYSTTYKVNPVTFEISSSKGINSSVKVEIIKGKYVFGY